MLDGIRKASKNWLGRAVLTVIMGILVLSFAIWGVGDMLRVTGNTYVAKVGKTEISGEAFRNAYNTSLEQVSQQVRRRITNEEARAFGLDRQVLSRLVGEAALDQRSKAMGLNLTDEDVVRAVMAEPSLRGANGQFDRQKFYEILRQNGSSEASFFAEQKRSMLRRQFATATMGDIAPPLAMVEAAYRYAAEQRVTKYFILPAAKAGEIAPPDETTLKAFYEARKADFRAPEYRKLNVLAALPRELGIDLTVTDADLRRVYDRGLASGQYGAPAKRQVFQILFPNDADAVAAALRISTGAKFEDIMAERNIKQADADLGLKTQREFADPKIGEAAFATAEGAVSQPVKTNFGTALLKVVKVDPGTQVPFEQAKASLGPAALTEKLRSDPKIQSRLDEIQKKVEEAKIAGKSLAEAAPGAGLTVRTIDAIDSAGLDKAGARIDLPGGDETVKLVFQSDIGLDNEAVRLREGGLLWFEIANVEGARDRGYDEIKPQLLAAWKTDEIGKRLAARAAEYVKRIDAGEDIAAIAKDAGEEVAEATVNRNNGQALGATGAAQAFAVAVGKGAQATVNKGDRVVLKVVESKLTPLDPASGVGLQYSRQIGNQLSEDLLAQYVQRLQTELGATIDAKVLQNALGGGGS